MASIAAQLQHPLLPTNSSKRDVSPKARRSVTFNPSPGLDPLEHRTWSVPTPNFPNPTNQAKLSLNNRIRRRSLAGILPPLTPSISNNQNKIGPQRTTKNAEKLKLLPNLDIGEGAQDEESGRDVYSQYTRIKDPNARRDAARLGKADRDRLPRVTAYCTSGKYQIDNVMRFFKGKVKSRGANPKLLDECIYSPYNYSNSLHSYDSNEVSLISVSKERSYSESSIGQITSHNIRRDSQVSQGAERDNAQGRRDSDQKNQPVNTHGSDNSSPEFDLNIDIEVHTPEIFVFSYGVVVVWGMSVQDEERFLKEISRFEIEKLDIEVMETECFNFYYTQDYQARIYNDFITLRDKNAYMTKLAISHALAQSVKTSWFEGLVDRTIESCKDIPGQIATNGKIALNGTQINMQIGELFILRINIHLNGSVLDTPEIFWLEPQLEPVYKAVRSYLEMDQRVQLLTDRLDVIADLLAVLKDQLNNRHSEKLEWIVIVLIATEILVAAINILVDLYSDGG